MSHRPRENVGMERDDDALEKALDDLYSVSLDDFVETRKRLVAELRAKGRKDDALILSKARKPTAAAWTLNQISRRYRKQAEWLFEANENLAKALSSKGATGPYREATRARHEIIKQLSESASRVLEEGGHAASPQAVKGIVDVLLSLGSSEASGARFMKGRLVTATVDGAEDFGTVVELDEAQLRDQELEMHARQQGKLAAEVSRLSERADLLEREAEEARQRAQRAAELAKNARREATAAQKEFERHSRAKP